ncbi:hypothetical protein BHU72_11330 [Desulfuribacillus stibiiarsenatis]|uniref:VOC domain-containing protein n=1 Tax=Desulfuribacillus stibiiarsenatis TaxID=1390249 RepID=A0A1E5L7X8_9FIRM|nr:hypothetical protein BHU72_11330 [Desulfuribacillus stibiiarsenatis]
MKVSKFRHVAIVVKDYKKMIDFYSKILGFEIIREIEVSNEEFRKGIGLPNAVAKGAHLAIPGNNVEIEMFQFEKKMDRCDELSIANYPGFRHIALIVENLGEAYASLKSKGIEFVSEPICMKEPPSVAGFRFVYFKDPEGNIIELNQLP